MRKNRPDYDLCIIGGGINGAGIARDAAGRGLSVILVEKGDLAGATSSASTKLIHGGLRYLEQYEFSLVRHALQERETLMGLAPHLIKPMTFILPHEPHLRPVWMIQCGLFLYDHLAKRKKLPASKTVSLKNSGLEEIYKKGFSYADCRVDDSRLVIVNAMDAAEKGAHILTGTECTGLTPYESGWVIDFANQSSLRARMVVNASGPWVRSVLEASNLARQVPGIRLVKGSHIVVPRFLDGENAYILQQPDTRIVFAIPYERDFTLIGTTDLEYKGDPSCPVIETAEIDYLCAAVNRSFQHKISPEEIVWHYSGVRPLLDDGDNDVSSVTRDYKLVLDESCHLKMLSVFGGKITTYRRLAEEAVNLLTDRPCWTAKTPLPGGDIPDFDRFLETQKNHYSNLPETLVTRYTNSYGTRMDVFLSSGKMGAHFGDHVYEAEIRYLIDYEWAQTIEDILWRRSKLGLHISDGTVKNIGIFLKRSLPSL
ncbi:MAG: glycerol-3-phosphate dehydrogenase [Alphaproteobacteria bacterium CG_4_9_14_3_um_filter_47_13]|nr:MAG: glycerol-3-phosphate dehydrogenase [Alphaproteobacteria bacterium CG_4_9_14_3_um_filter_47_13]